MSEEHLALLKSLVIRPSRTIPPSIEPLANALFDAGYVTRSPDGWIATAEGCNLIETQTHYNALMRNPYMTDAVMLARGSGGSLVPISRV